jgi:ankyrin repeat protein
MDLHAAAATGDLEVIRKNIEAGSDLNTGDPQGGACPLSAAALCGNAEAGAGGRFICPLSPAGTV